MKKFAKRGLTFLLVLAVCFSLLPALTFTADAATVNYVKNGNYVYNWGEREELATFLSPMAEDFYEKNNVTYNELAALSGSSNQGSVPSSALYKRLQTLMKSNHKHQTSYNETKELFRYTDCQNSGGKISSFYSGTAIGPSWDGNWNREHTWPNSKGDAADNGENDIMMLRPTSTSENSSRGNKAYGTKTSASYYNPNDEGNDKYDLRGDVARIVLYVYVRWGCTNTGSKYNPNGIFGADGVIESEQVMLQWIKEDPVDTWELGRNDSVESITGTRNVFVDYPELAFVLFDEEIPEDMDTPSSCAHEDSFSVSAVAATCTQPGNTAGRYCNNCEKYYDGYSVIAAKGHSYTGVVTPPTETTSGYTTYTCGGCGHSYIGNQTGALGVTYTVSFDVPAGVNAVADMGCNSQGITLPAAEEPTDTYTFVGWTTAPVTDATAAPTIYQAGAKFTATTNTTLYALYTYGVGGTGVAEYVLTDLSKIKDTDTVVITVEYEGTIYAMYNANGTSTAPTAIIVKASNNKLTQTPANTLLWNIATVSGGYTIYPAGTTDKWLYSTNANNGIRVGTNAAKVFTYDVNSGYLKHTGTGRYMGVYRGNPDWRGYTSTGTNITNQTYGFYVKTETGTLHYSTLSCDHAETYVNNGDTHNVVCGSCGKAMATNADHTYTNGKCPCGAEEFKLFDIPNMRMQLNNSLQADFAVKQTDVPDKTGYYAEITQEGKSAVTVAATEWSGQNGVWVVPYTGMAAKEMMDQITVVIYNAEGQAVSNPYETTLAAYAVRAFDKAVTNNDAKGKTLYVEMLYYGAAAQAKFNHKAATPATDVLTAAMQAVERSDAAQPENPSVANNLNYAGSRLVLEYNIQLNAIFNVTYTEGTTTVQVTANGNPCVALISAYGSGQTSVVVNSLALTNCSDDVTIEVYENGTLVASCTDAAIKWAARSINKTSTAEVDRELAQSVLNFSKAVDTYFAN